MSEFRIGSCRIDSQPYLYNHVHNTKQILISLKFLLNNIDKNKYDLIHTNPLSVNIINIIKTNFLKAKTIIIEISSLKLWKNANNDYIHWGNYKAEQTNYYENISKQEFMSDLNEIHELLNNKTVVFVSHINLPINNFKEMVNCNGETRWLSNKFVNKNERGCESNIIDLCKIKQKTLIENRELIENYIDLFITNKNSVVHIKPYAVLKKFSEMNNISNIDIFFEMNNNSIDTNHYSEIGKKVIYNFLHSIVV